MDQSDLEAFLDFNQMASPAMDKGKGRLTQTPTLTSPSSFQYFDLPDEQQTPMQPSHDYGQYKQQIGLPLQSQSMFASYNSGVFGSQMLEAAGSSSSNGGGMLGGDLDSFFNYSQTDDLVDPSFILKEEEQQSPIRYYPGMHQQQAELAKQMMLKQKQREAAEQQRAEASRRSASLQPLDQMRDETISRVMNEMRRNSSISDAVSPPTSHVLPNIKGRRDDEDMDDDERLLNSEEGKKLSSKERRQLRNKVSARAFRSRRKEYIGQLEAQIAAKSNEANALKRENQALMAENARYHALAEKLISHPAFMPYLEELSRDPSIADSIAQIASGTPPASSQSSIPKDVPQFSSSHFIPSNNDAIVGMALIPEIPVDLSSLNIGSNHWPLPQSMDTFHTQVFAVTEVTPTVEPIDVSALSGKGEDVVSQYLEDEEEKPSFPEISTPQSTEEVKETSEALFDENDPTETLFATESSTPKRTDSEPEREPEQEPIFGGLPAEKAFARYEVVVVAEVDEEVFATELNLKFARLEASFRRLEAMAERF